MVVIACLASGFGDLEAKYGITTVGEVESGLKVRTYTVAFARMGAVLCSDCDSTPEET